MIHPFLNILRGILEAPSNLIEEELNAYKNIFALLIMSNFIGLPIFPTSLSLKIIPYIEEEILTMLEHSMELDDQLMKWIGSFDIG
ncbi:MAG: hypothetical protein SVN78_03770 [Deferribacterota bacterium]|nr:hypothetical protein [Deferribacterota bacterium]